ncbi:hypothetical protein [Rouxiella sp. WC2420]|uniref:Uncharacterized protein n=1 Tax=Rouxiella sp. WC2420 TaxID=3234145 RepID=A0AB39VLH3_9GAMM
MSDTVVPVVATSSRISANAGGTATAGTSLLAVYTNPVFVNLPLLNAMGVEIDGENYAPIWDMLNIGGRITQDTNAIQKVGPGILADISITDINRTLDTTDETDVVQEIYKNQLLIADNLNYIVSQINLHRENYTILLQYMINYKLLNSASS